ncbi:MAG: protease [Bryobacterales bacterium]|nr:protease [Bryobacterales bacterium]
MVAPRSALDRAGAKTTIVSPVDQQVRGWNFTEWGDRFRVDLPTEHRVDEEAVVDGNLVSSPKPDDIPAFNNAMIEVFSRAPVRA